MFFTKKGRRKMKADYILSMIEDGVEQAHAAIVAYGQASKDIHDNKAKAAPSRKGGKHETRQEHVLRLIETGLEQAKAALVAYRGAGDRTVAENGELNGKAPKARSAAKRPAKKKSPARKSRAR